MREDALRETRRRAGENCMRKGLSPETVAALRAAIEGVPDDFEEQAKRQGIGPESIAAIRTVYPRRPR